MRDLIHFPSLFGDFNEWRLTLMAPLGWPGRVLALLAAAFILFFAYRALRGDTRRRRGLLLGLRAGGLAAILVLVLQPALQLRNVTRLPNHIAVLVDTSESMRVSERGDGESRSARVAALLARDRGVIARWQEQHKIDVFTFGDRLQPATLESVSRSGGHEARADATRIRDALASVRQRYEGRDLAGVVLLSDGLDNGRLAAALDRNEGRNDGRNDGRSDGRSDGNGKKGTDALDADTLDFLRTLDAPVHTVSMGRPGLRDVAITRVFADQFAFARTPVEVEARLLVLGAEEAGWYGRHVPLTLKRDGVPVLSVDIELSPGQREYRVVFPFTPERVGKYLYEISAPTLPGEAIAENNRDRKSVV